MQGCAPYVRCSKHVGGGGFIKPYIYMFYKHHIYSRNYIYILTKKSEYLIEKRKRIVTFKHARM